MRRLLPTAKTFLIHSGQTAALAGLAVMAMAAAPYATPTEPVVRIEPWPRPPGR